MDFIQYLKSRHQIRNNARQINDISARQYNNRLENMIRWQIYDGKSNLNDEIVEKIEQRYSNKANEYERTIKYFIEFKNYVKGK